MTGESFAHDWPGRGARGHRRHGRHAKNWMFAQGPGGPGTWAFAKEKGKGRHTRPTEEDLEDLIALRRMRGGPWGSGPFGGGPFGGGPFGGRHHRGSGRGRARRGDVRLALLRLLAEEPRNGYQLMQTIEERSGGRWRPSPGSVYPTLSQLEDEGLVRSTESEGARHFEITDAGREHLETRADEPAPWDAGEEGPNPLKEIAPLVIGIGKAAWQVATDGDETQRERAIETLSETRRTLYRILAEEPEGEAPQA